MSVALRYEQHRLRKAGQPNVEIFDPSAPDEQATVFNVSTPRSLRAAMEGSARLRDVMAYLADHGVSQSFPGFDLLSLDLEHSGLPGRLIELKSSGVNAIVQAMTWNEWKTARSSDLRPFFYLYLVGNLRSDLRGARPFIRAIHDPFGAMFAVELEEVTRRRSVQLRVREFPMAEHLDLTVASPEAIGS